jgi:hypothetical protein
MQLLQPGEDSRWATAADRVPPLGSIYWLDLDGDASDSLRALRETAAAPWVPVLVSGAPHAIEAFLEATPFPQIVVRSVGPRPDAALARGRVARMQMPEPASLAEWIVCRLGMQADPRWLQLILEDGTPVKPTPAVAARPWLAAGVSRRGFYRKAMAFGPLSPANWHRIVILAGQALRGETTVEYLASEVGIGTKALRHGVQRMLGCRLAEYRASQGWVWVLETALRKHGYTGARCRRRHDSSGGRVDPRTVSVRRTTSYEALNAIKATSRVRKFS